MRSGRLIVVAAATMTLSGCVTPDPPYEEMVAACPASMPTTDGETLFFATSRLPDCRTQPFSMTRGRADKLRYGQIAKDGLLFRAHEEWEADIATRAAGASGRLILYVHGYNNDFDAAAGRARSLSGIEGGRSPVVAFTWPSQAKTERYTWDEENSAWTEPYFRGTLERLLVKPEIESVAIVAHSMGNRVVLRALTALQDRAVAGIGKVDTLVLASPDVDRAIFERDYVPAIIRDGRSVTVYRSNQDYPLNVSWRVHGYPRTGDANCRPWRRTPSGEEITCRNEEIQSPRIAFVDTSDVRARGFGHADFIDSKVAARDLGRVLARETTFPERCGDPAWSSHFRLRAAAAIGCATAQAAPSR